jgi:translation initiation factor IF-2
MAIRTLTEFSGTLIRMAAKAEAEARKALPPELKAVATAPAPKEPEVTAQPTPHAHGAADVPHAEPEVEGGPGEKSESAAFSSATEAADEAAAVEKAAEAPAPAAAASGDEMAETDAVKEVLDKAVGEATGTTGDRLARLRESVKAAGRQAERVRLVRVFGGEDVVVGAKKIGEHQFLVDLMPASMKQVFKDPKDEKSKSRGPKRPSGSTKNKDSASLEGAFSMESLAADRKNERGAGGPRKPGGPGGGRPGGRPGGAGRPGGGAGRGKPSPKP